MIIGHYVPKQSQKSLREKLLNVIGKNEGVSLGVILNRLRKTRRDEVVRELQWLYDAGQVVASETEPHPKTGAVTLKFTVSK